MDQLEGGAGEMTFNARDLEQLSSAFSNSAPPAPTPPTQNPHDIFQSGLDMGTDYGNAGLGQSLGAGLDNNATATTANLGQQLMNYNQQQAARATSYPQLPANALQLFSSTSFAAPSFSSPSFSAAASPFSQSNLAQQTLGALASQGFFQPVQNLLQQQQQQQQQQQNLLPNLLSHFTNNTSNAGQLPSSGQFASSSLGSNSSSNSLSLVTPTLPLQHQLRRQLEPSGTTGTNLGFNLGNLGNVTNTPHSPSPQQQASFQLALSQQAESFAQSNMLYSMHQNLPSIGNMMTSAGLQHPASLQQQQLQHPAMVPVTTSQQHQGTTASGMMIFHDKMTGKNFLVPTGPPTTNEISEVPPPPSSEISDSIIGDPKSVLDVSEFLNIPPKPDSSPHEQQQQQQHKQQLEQHKQLLQQHKQQLQLQQHKQVLQHKQQMQKHKQELQQLQQQHQQQQRQQQQQTFEPISDEEGEEERKELRFEPISDVEETSLATKLPKPTVAPSRGKDLQKALQKQIEDMTHSDGGWSDSDEDESTTVERNISIPSQVVPQCSDLYKTQPEAETGGGDSELATKDGNKTKPSSSKIDESVANLQEVMKNEAGNFVVQVEEKQCIVVDGARRWKCLRCPKMYSSKHNLITHILGHEGIKPHHCPQCSKTFKQPSHLATHLLTHSTSKAHRCHVCSRAFTQGSHLKRHLATHMSEQPHQCSVCRRGFAYPGELRQHMEKAHGEKVAAAAAQSGASAKEEEEEEEEEDSAATSTSKKPHKASGQQQHICPMCSQVYPSAKQLEMHKQATHKDDSDLTCKDCNRMFVYPSQLRDHELKHKGNRPYQCKDCDRKFMKEHHLRAHEFTHTGLQPFICPHCQRRFNQKANLQRHLLIHQDQKLFTCPVCVRSFSQSQVLKAHMTIHAEHKPYKCNICSKEFSRQHNLKGHLALHRGGKQYVCYCGASFTLKGNLNRHQKFKHGKKVGEDSTAEDTEETEGLDHQEVAHILQGMSHHQTSHQEDSSTADKNGGDSHQHTTTNDDEEEEEDWAKELNISSDIMDAALRKSPPAEKKRFLSFEEITAEDSEAMTRKTGRTKTLLQHDQAKRTTRKAKKRKL